MTDDQLRHYITHYVDAARARRALEASGTIPTRHKRPDVNHRETTYNVAANLGVAKVAGPSGWFDVSGDNPATVQKHNSGYSTGRKLMDTWFIWLLFGLMYIVARYSGVTTAVLLGAQ